MKGSVPRTSQLDKIVTYWKAGSACSGGRSSEFPLGLGGIYQAVCTCWWRPTSETGPQALGFIRDFIYLPDIYFPCYSLCARRTLPGVELLRLGISIDRAFISAASRCRDALGPYEVPYMYLGFVNEDDGFCFDRFGGWLSCREAIHDAHALFLSICRTGRRCSQTRSHICVSSSLILSLGVLQTRYMCASAASGSGSRGVRGLEWFWPNGIYNSFFDGAFNTQAIFSEPSEV